MNDMIVQIMLHFVHDAALPIMERVVSRDLCIKDGVEQMFSLIPTSQYNEVVQFALDATRIRPGFEGLVRRVTAAGGRFVVVSGGFDFFVKPALASVRDLVEVCCNYIDASGPTLRVVWHTLCDELCDGGCGMCKPTILRSMRRPDVTIVAIGDGVTDVKLVRFADIVFARDKLAQIAEHEGIAFSPFETFTDIERALLNSHCVG